MIESLVRLLRPLQFRGKARLLSPFVSKTGKRTASVHGYQMELDLSEYIQRMVFLGAYEREETRLISQYLRPKMTVVDVGANVGYHTLLSARLVGRQGVVIAVEPSRYAAEKLANAIRENQLVQVRLERFGLGRENGVALLSRPAADNHTPTMLVDATKPHDSVDVFRLDDCVAKWGVETIDLLKLDVEGYEPAVLEGAAQLLRSKRIRAILCEFNRDWLSTAGCSSEKLYRQIIAAGYRDATPTIWNPLSDLQNRLFML